MSDIHALALVLVVALCTFAIRALPFVLFGGSRELPAPIVYLGKVLPPAVMATLVVYCVRSTTFASVSGFAPQFIALAAVAVLHVWKRNVLLSMFGGTAVYMLLVQIVFA